MERRTGFTRQASGEETIGQVVAANIDVVFLVNSLDQRFSLRRLERYLTLGWQSGAQPVILLTKTDLCDDTERFVLEAEIDRVRHRCARDQRRHRRRPGALDAHIRATARWRCWGCRGRASPR